MRKVLICVYNILLVFVLILVNSTAFQITSHNQNKQQYQYSSTISSSSTSRIQLQLHYSTTGRRIIKPKSHHGLINRLTRTFVLQESASSINTNANTNSIVNETETRDTTFDDWYNDDNKNTANSNNNQLQYGYISEKYRNDFPILERVSGETLKSIVYLDSAATSQKPMYVINAINDYYMESNANVHRGAHTLSREATEMYENARVSVQQLIHAQSSNEIIFTAGATDGINLLAHTYSSYALKDGDEIILTVAEHHSNIVPWQIIVQEQQRRYNNTIKIHYIDIDDSTGLLNWNQLHTLLHSTKTKLVSFQHVSNVLGYINPVKDIIQLIRQKAPNAKVLIDACQSIPHMTINVQEYDIDFLVASGHKMCGPTGIGFLYGKEYILNNMTPIYKSGGEMIDIVTLETTTYLPCPARYEAGTPPIAQAIGLQAAIKYISNVVGMTNIEHYETELGTYCYKLLKDTIPEIQILGPNPLSVVSSSLNRDVQEEVATNDSTSTSSLLQPDFSQYPIQRVGLCTFYHPTVHSSDIATFLDLQGIAIRSGHHCCQPLHTRLNINHSARASFYFYNTKEEIDFFVEELKKTIDFFTSVTGTSTTNTDDNTDNFVPFI